MQSTCFIHANGLSAILAILSQVLRGADHAMVGVIHIAIPFSASQGRVGWRLAGVSTAGRRSSSLQGRIHGVPRQTPPDPEKPKIEAGRLYLRGLTGPVPVPVQGSAAMVGRRGMAWQKDSDRAQGSAQPWRLARSRKAAWAWG